MKKIMYLIPYLFFALANAQVDTFYVAVNGSDSNPGSISKPFSTWRKAISMAGPGDVIFVREGTYHESSSSSRALTIENKSGNENNRIKLFAYPGERAVLDCSNLTRSSAEGITFDNCNYWHFKGFEIINVPAYNNGDYSVGFFVVNSDYNIFEGLKIHNNQAVGMNLTGNGNLVKNCDFYLNNDVVSNGEYADGLQVSSARGDSNRVVGCRMYYNSDDGIDNWDEEGIVVYDSVWCFWNGYNEQGVVNGNGNGFKLGRTQQDPLNRPQRYLRNCLAVQNKERGIDQNGAEVSIVVYNSTVYDNKDHGIAIDDYSNLKHYFSNVIEYKNTRTNSFSGTIIENTNSWNGFYVDDSDFISLNSNQLSAPRQADGTLPVITFLALAEGSDMDNKGTDVGLAFYGEKPDLGAIQNISENELENHSPEISNQQFEVLVTSQTPSFIGNVKASEPDSWQSLLFSIVSGNSNNLFRIENNGNLSFVNAGQLNISSETTYTIAVRVTDNAPSPLSAESEIKIHCVPEEVEINHAPVIENQQFDITYDGSLQAFIGVISASDEDSQQELRFSIISGNADNLFFLNSSNGELYFDDINKINIGANTTYSIGIRVTDNGSGPLSDDATITINLIYSVISDTYYIDPTNTNDPDENGSIEHPFNSWQDVKWNDGYHYMQKKGTVANLDKIIISANDVTLGAYGAGELPLIQSTSNDHIMMVYNKKNLNIEDLHIRAENAISNLYILGPQCENISITGCIIEGASNGVRIIDGKNVFLKGNSFFNNNIAVYSVSETTEIYYNLFRDNETGISINSNLSNAKVFNNVFYNNHNAVNNTYASFTFYNNIIYLTDTEDKAVVHNSGELASDCNIYYPVQAGFMEVYGSTINSVKDMQELFFEEMNSFDLDPLFTDAANNDFSIESESPAIDNGKVVNVESDYHGNLVPFGNGPDIGILESAFIGKKLSGYNLLKSKDLSIYPNPTKGIFYISIPEASATLNLNIFILDLMGRQIMNSACSFAGREAIRFDLSDFRKGIYLVKILFDQQLVSKKIIVN
ncbi:MAG: cadherin domain-containing protein [Bacteroidales bacterium]|nr:cadherin domain-containing protein [Bacteroidales bacterium]